MKNAYNVFQFASVLFFNKNDGKYKRIDVQTVSAGSTFYSFRADFV